MMDRKESNNNECKDNEIISFIAFIAIVIIVVNSIFLSSVRNNREQQDHQLDRQNDATQALDSRIENKGNSIIPSNTITIISINDSIEISGNLIVRKR